MKTITSQLAVATALSFAVAATPALAQSEADNESTPDLPVNSSILTISNSIVVSAEGLEELDFIAGQDALEVEEILQNLDGQIGEVLDKLPGVSATSFAPGASRPILRGQDGERVRILIDGLGTADVASTSADHATTIDPLTVERIEVLRGPTALLFGSQALGGVVNVIDRRIPTEVPENGVRVDAITAFDTASDLRSGGASLDVGLGEMFVFHVDGSYRETNDLEIPGFQLTEELRADLLADAAEEEAEGELEEAAELREAAAQEDFLPNSATETYTVNGGIGVILGDSTFGASVGYYDTFYGIVGNPEGGHHGEEGEEGEEEEGEEEAETVSIGLEQWRFDFKGDIALGGGFADRLKIRAGYSDYTHTEFEGTEIGTVFDTETFEARAELIQTGGGVIGAQFTSRDFEAVGEEAFVAPNDTTQFAVFTVQEFDLGFAQLETAGRYENVDVESETVGVDRNFNLFSGAVSLVGELEEERGRVGLTVSRSERAPAGEELFANGPHIATQSFEIGDPNLGTEEAWGVEAFIRLAQGDATVNFAAYFQTFSDYIFLNPTGEEEDDLPVFEFLQSGAEFFGFEADANIPLVEADSYTLTADLRASYVEAKLSGDLSGPVPRIPPLSLLGALEADIDAFNIRGEIQHAGGQESVVEFETPTDSFTFVNLYLTWRPLQNNQNLSLQLAGENLFDTTGRRHSSFTKDFVPLAGRNIRASARLSF
ncbi:TonB-dependent receptor [uncultured Erythrobacter sp.]|uniref:TonB-dependent receptor n=1 Tax=uncultured Erythrobacter sp. TaxID=263913 RepID=UPI00262C05E1|nr:TonB-dependent receptor [uncultured Erythrobacter sp.]